MYNTKAPIPTSIRFPSHRRYFLLPFGHPQERDTRRKRKQNGKTCLYYPKTPLSRAQKGNVRKYDMYVKGADVRR